MNFKGKIEMKGQGGKEEFSVIVATNVMSVTNGKGS